MDNPNDIARVFINDFTKRFKFDNPRMIPEMFDSFSPCISKEENRDLIKDVFEDEILIALLKINSLKALGPDGLQASFYKKYWKIIGISIGKMVRTFFYNGHLLKEIDWTFTTLIPKVDTRKPQINTSLLVYAMCVIKW